MQTTTGCVALLALIADTVPYPVEYGFGWDG